MNLNNNTSKSNGAKIALGVILVLIGIALLGFNYNFLPDYWWNVFFTWQTFLILLGIILLFSKTSKLSGIVLIFIGGIFIIPEFTGYDLHYRKIFLPIILILIGIGILFKKQKTKNPFKKGIASTSGILNESAIFSGSEIIFTESEFRGGEINAIFGGYHLNLTKTNLPLGTTFLEMNAIFGGIEIVVPDTWKVTSKTTAVFGAFEDKRYNKIVLDAERELVITGSIIFGSGELKSH